MARPTPIPIPKHPPWIIQILVLRTLIWRQYQSKFGKYHLGFLWVILEPLSRILILGFVLGRIAQRTVPEIPYAFFLLNGLMLLHLCTGCMSAGMKGVEAGKNMIVYPAIKPIDPLIARFVFQFLVQVTAYAVFCLASLYLGVGFSLSSLHSLLYCYFITWVIGSGLGLIMGVGIAHYQELQKIMTFIQSPLLFISAVLFPSSSIPDSERKYLLWNPLVHTIEQARLALFPNYNATETQLYYPTVFAIVVFALGITMFQNNRQYLTSRK